MRFHLATIGAALYATTALCAIVTLQRVNGTSCILSIKNLGPFTGASETIGTYYPNNNTCSDYVPGIPINLFSAPIAVEAQGSQRLEYLILYYFYPGEQPAGTVVIDGPYKKNDTYQWHSRINPSLVGIPENFSVLNGLPPGVVL
ncbi:uncharacterized protein N7483_008667 [Penicillium malachiteum]|uniref:uncharacterized protein n=1 Tax=Penicillium malachiteum TaxID=1324776 RepID=UPI002546B1F5|nr:uncharacterized protein N7483_008667 [Penicillium malachiteum]KAJ5720733.1 hypothetical protein N7483_008667 [Penicillium malachiteum]